ncbi:MAG: exosome complex protein Rrp42 [Methanophagales archaeon]|nr:exosome complex protein Rrp42 [Methanophagales archaeon]
MGLEIMDDVRRDYIYNLVKRGKREDGRDFRDYREIKVEKDIIKRAEGSARVKIGNTEVLVGVKLEPGEPFPDSPDEGVIITNAELVPLASPEFEPGPPNEDSVQLARVVDRGIRGSEAIDLSKLCIEEGEKVWIVFIDIHVLDNDGNLVDAAALGAIAALLNIHIPAERYGLSSSEGEDTNTLPIRDKPVAVTMVDVGGEILVDPNYNEEKAAVSGLTVITNTDGTISGMQKYGREGLAEDKISEMVEIGIEKADELRRRFL